MASGRISASLYPANSTQWRHLLRATLRECTYLPDPIARSYMRAYVLERYRRGADQPNRSETVKARAARNQLSVLRRANEGYQKPLDNVLYKSYGRIGRRRAELLRWLMTREVPPADTSALREIITQPLEFEDGWEPPKVILSLVKSQMHNGVLSSTRVRPQPKYLEPPIPEENAWGKPVDKSRRRNIRKKWYARTLNCLLPPLPERELAILDSLIAGTVPWAPVERRKGKPSISQDNDLVNFLTDGPQKGHTFREYVNGRPHNLTVRFMRRQWRRISCLVPRMQWSAEAMQWRFVWDTPNKAPQFFHDLADRPDLDDIFGEVTKSPPEALPKGQPTKT